MPMILKASLWALAVIVIALLGATGVLPVEFAEHSNWILPALASAVLILPACQEGCQNFYPWRRS